ncbi:alpha/beta hydrolase [Rhodoglobus aureus]|uniref:Phospholipase/carboxylesterase/thioesterase domain-containing protein n=1 Tax=Rhodoglobus aureus TaxID=191497 RepID=A0ABP4GGZ1_9MICO
MQIDSSAVLWSAPERERAGRPLLVLLHGYGSHEGDLFAMAPGLPLEPVIASLRAPIPENGGFSWFPINLSGDGRHNVELVDDAARAVLSWLDDQQFTSVSLLGFSQGAAMALQLLRLAPERFTCAVALSGFVVSAEHSGDAALTSIRPPVFWGRGTDDAVIPAVNIERTETWLVDHTRAESHIYEGLAHSISTDELNDFVSFLGTHA